MLQNHRTLSLGLYGHANHMTSVLKIQNRSATTCSRRLEAGSRILNLWNGHLQSLFLKEILWQYSHKLNKILVNIFFSYTGIFCGFLKQIMYFCTCDRYYVDGSSLLLGIVARNIFWFRLRARHHFSAHIATYLHCVLPPLQCTQTHRLPEII